MTRKSPDGTWHYIYIGGYIEDKQPDGSIYRTPVETFGDMPARTMTEAEWDAAIKPFYVLDKQGLPTKDFKPGVEDILNRLYRRTFVSVPTPEEGTTTDITSADGAPQEG